MPCDKNAVSIRLRPKHLEHVWLWFVSVSGETVEMDEGLPYETLPLPVPSECLAHLVLISLSSYLNTHTADQQDSERQEIQWAYSVSIQTEPHIEDK